LQHIHVMICTNRICTGWAACIVAYLAQRMFSMCWWTHYPAAAAILVACMASMQVWSPAELSCWSRSAYGHRSIHLCSGCKSAALAPLWVAMCNKIFTVFLHQSKDSWSHQAPLISAYTVASCIFFGCNTIRHSVHYTLRFMHSMLHAAWSLWFESIFFVYTRMQRRT